jgi:hypothetical protein
MPHSDAFRVGIPTIYLFLRRAASFLCEDRMPWKYAATSSAAGSPMRFGRVAGTIRQSGAPRPAF